MHLFIQGQARIGKSTILRKVIEPVALDIVGFVTQRIMRNESIVGYRALSATGALPSLETVYDANEQGVFLLKGRMDISVLEMVISQVEQSVKSQNCGLVLLDEIGGVELKSDIFKGSLLRILNSNKPCIGVWKSALNLSHTMSMLNLDNEYLSSHEELERIICSKGELLSVTNENKSSIQEYLRHYVQQRLCVT